MLQHQVEVLHAAGWVVFCALNGEVLWVGPKGQLLGTTEAVDAALSKKSLSRRALSRRTA